MPDDRYPDYPMFKGLQRPLELMGLQGRYIYWAALTVGGGIIGFVVMYIIFGFIVALISLVAVLCSGAALILLKQRRGLHSKKIDKGVFVYCRAKSL